MLIIPFDRPIDWRRPPVVTFALVAVNVLVFLGFQLDDGRELQRVKTYYYESGLAEIELPRYRAWLKAQGDDPFVEHFGDRIDDPASPWFGRIVSDEAFTRRLEAGKVIGPDHPEYERWQRGREGLAQRLDQTTVWGHGLRPAESAPTTFLTHMFLHGGWFHLIGNMLFLITLGLLVEVALGSLVLTGLYVLSGFGAAGLFIALQPQGLMPLVGASGAVAGLVGLCGVLYGLRRIRFFYFIGFYFDYVKAPALVLLGLWLGKEVYQYIRFSELSNVAFTAHIGGILTGALAGAAVRFGTNAVDEEAMDERERTEAFERELGAAHERLAAMEPDRARPLFERMVRNWPDNVRVLDGLFRASRFAPASDAYHDAVHRILRLEPTDDETAELMVTAFRDYRRRARPKPKIGGAVLERMIDLLLRRGSAEEVAPLVQAALKHPQRFNGIEESAIRLARKYQREGERARARSLYHYVLQHFADTAAARQAERALTEVR
ncbi:rhomboid family intramembrane serine protease [Halofilum ochraceum]|uniref:rhomboid family intramembrane serine protease n=1 Tax=Halofilum ochraceum TaxID=1611323 RepID=UPI00083513BF|nr:rhomboid family intramembrane serine protease [Halofilum ochraceum]